MKLLIIGGDVIDRIFQVFMDIETIGYGLSIHLKDLFNGLIFAGLAKLIIYSKSKNAKKFRKGEEYGFARWGAYY